MSWLSTLEETYDYLLDYEIRNPGTVDGLLPPGVLLQNAHLEVTLDSQAHFVRAKDVQKEDSPTAILVTDKSAGRTGKEPHVIFDQLTYIAGDLKDYIAQDKDAAESCYDLYIEGLKEYVVKSKNEFADVVYKYLEKKSLTSDLIKSNILQLDNDKIDMSVKRQSADQTKFVVRFSIEKDGELNKLWVDKDFIDEYSNYFLSQFKSNPEDFCYATGKRGHIARKHGGSIRFSGDKAKLISSNDSENYTYKGRLRTPEETAIIGGITSEKAHSALRWLIKNQAYSRNGYTVLAWDVNQKEVTKPMDDTFDIFQNFFGTEDMAVKMLEIGDVFSKNLKKAIVGRTNLLDRNRKINIMAIDSATTGRMSILYYAEKLANDYIESLEKWHKELAWGQSYSFKGDKQNDKTNFECYKINYISAPSSYDIILCSFGKEEGEGKNKILKLSDKNKFINQQLRRLLPCIVDQARLPRDFMLGAYKNAINPVSKTNFNWNKCLIVACSLIRKYYIDTKGVDYKMALDTTIKDRSYLYGRLLAIADKVEGDVLRIKEIERQTNAKRSMEAFAKRPYKTWSNIELSLTSYWQTLSLDSRIFYDKLLNEVMSQFKTEDFANNKPLEPLFLLGFHSQMQEFYKKVMK